MGSMQNGVENILPQDHELDHTSYQAMLKKIQSSDQESDKFKSIKESINNADFMSDRRKS